MNFTSEEIVEVVELFREQLKLHQSLSGRGDSVVDGKTYEIRVREDANFFGFSIQEKK